LLPPLNPSYFIFVIFSTASENTPLASDLDEADNASGTTSSSEAKSEKTDNPNTPTLQRENSKPEPAKPGWFGKGKRKRKMLKT
jgi:hypothetical protein